MNNRKCECLLISQHFLHSAYGFFFFSCKVPTLDIWPQIIHPPKSTTLPRPWQTWKIKEEIWIHAHAPNQINMGGKKKHKSKRHSEEEFSTIYAVLSYQLALASVSSSRCRIFWYKPSTSDLLRGSTALYSKYPSHSNEPSPSLWDYPQLTWGSDPKHESLL